MLQKRYFRVLLLGALCILLMGCSRLDCQEFWIRENIPETQTTFAEVTATEMVQRQTEELCIDGSVDGETDLCFTADLQALCNDFSILWKRQLTKDSWQMEHNAHAPYSRMHTKYLRLDADPVLKNEPTLCVYLSEEGRINEVTAILLTHDWTEMQEGSFLQLGKYLLKCFWQDCDEAVLTDTVEKLRTDIGNNVYPDNSAVPRPMTVYVCNSAAAYGYNHAAHISMNVIPVNDTRLQELQEEGVQIVEIS